MPPPIMPIPRRPGQLTAENAEGAESAKFGLSLCAPHQQNKAIKAVYIKHSGGYQPPDSDYFQECVNSEEGGSRHQPPASKPTGCRAADDKTRSGELRLCQKLPAPFSPARVGTLRWRRSRGPEGHDELLPFGGRGVVAPPRAGRVARCAWGIRGLARSASFAASRLSANTASALEYWCRYAQSSFLLPPDLREIPADCRCYGNQVAHVNRAACRGSLRHHVVRKSL